MFTAAAESLTLGPQVVDARAASQQVQITAQAYDTGAPGPLTGIGRFEVFLSGGRTVVTTYAGGHSWVGTTVVRRWSRSGPLTVVAAALQDRAFYPDWKVIDDEEGPFWDTYCSGSTLSPVGGDRSVDVLTVEDASAPRITDVDLYPAIVNTRKRAKSVYVTARAQDGGSGVLDAQAHFSQGTGYGYGEFRRSAHMRVLPGRHGLLRGRLVVPRRIGSRPAKLTVVVRDNGVRSRELTPTKLLDRGLPHQLGIRSGARPPAGQVRIRKVTASTRRVDVRTADKPVTYRMRVTNRRGRVLKVRFNVHPWAQVRQGRPRLVSGDRHDGIWSVTVVVDSCLATSDVFLPSASADDRIHQVTRDLPGLTVVAEDRVTPEQGSFELDMSGRMSMQFNEAVNGIDAQSMPVIDMANRRPVPGTWTCYTSDGGSCLTGSVLGVTFEPVTPLPSGETYGFYVNPNGNLGVTDLAGNPAHRSRSDLLVP